MIDNWYVGTITGESCVLNLKSSFFIEVDSRSRSAYKMYLTNCTELAVCYRPGPQVGNPGRWEKGHEYI